MIEILSLSIVIILTIITGFTFRQQYKHNHLSSCLAMFVTMTMSTLVGILVATWVVDMVLATIISILGSLVLIIALTYKLPAKIFIESLGALFMGAMMGAMLSLMTTNYAVLSIVFFTAFYIGSVILAIGLWNKEEYPIFRKAIPSLVTVTATLALVVLGISAVTLEMNDQEVEQPTHHHH